MAYCTATEFQESTFFTGLEEYFTSTTQIEDFLEDVSSLIDNYCGRTFATGSYSEEFVGSNNGSFLLPIFPLISIDSITYQQFTLSPAYTTALDTTAVSGTIDTSNVIYTREGLVKSNLAFTTNRIYTVTYTAGYQTANIPRPIKTATMQLARILADSTDTGNLAWADGATVSQFKFGKFTETYTTNTNRSTMAADNLPPTIALLLRRYRYSKSV